MTGEVPKMPWDVYKKKGMSDAQIRAIYANRDKNKEDNEHYEDLNSTKTGAKPREVNSRKEALIRRLKSHKRMGK